MVEQNYSDYINSIKDALKNDLKDFKQDPRYREVLEHVPQFLGKEYLKNIDYKIDKEKLKEYILLNDQIGFPETFYYDEIGINASPTSLRYAYQANDILNYLSSNGITFIKILEIGAGYGGLPLALQFFAPLHGIIIMNIYLIDLREPIKLQKEYLKRHNKYQIVKFIYSDDIDELGELPEDTFLIANYSLSELSNKVCNDYLEYVKKFRHAYINWNGEPYGNKYEPLIEGKSNVNISQEKIVSSEFNKLITYF